MPRPKISLLGGLQFHSSGGEPVAVPARKAQALLAFLARHADRPLPRGKMASLLWEDSEESQQRASLRQTLTVLRAIDGLGTDALVTATADTLTLHSGHADIDVLQFERQAAQDMPDALADAVALYAGEFLEAFNPKAPAFEDWMTMERQSLRARAVEAMTRLLDHQVGANALDRAVETALRLLAFDPLQESVHRALMSLYARQGRQALALRQFQLCRDVLRRELDVSPEAETERLFRDIQEQRRRKTEPADWPLAPAPQPPEPEASADTGFPFGETVDPAPIAELRQVTVLCAELAEPQGGLDADPEEVQLRADRFIETARAAVAAYGGTAETNVGGSVIAFFGLPAAHGNDAERAARAGFAIQAGWAGQTGDEATEIRIGIADGKVLVNQGAAGNGRAIAGGVVNVAARMAANAQPGELLVTDLVRQALWKLAEMDEERNIALPGAGGTLRAFRLECLRSEPWTVAKLVGREPELGQLKGALEACREHGNGLAIHLRGEAGIGKTRLVEELQAMAREQGFACHQAAALDFGASERRDVIGSLTGSLLSVHDVEEEGEAIRRAFSEGILSEGFEPHLYDLLRLPQPEHTRAIYDAMDNATRAQGAAEALAELVRGASARQRRLIVLEDMHWADRPALALAAGLAAAVGDCPALLAMTSRTESDPLDAEWRAVAGGCRLITLDLGPLREQDGLALAEQHSGEVNGFARKCVERSGGNPLFLEQLLHSDKGGDALPGTVESVVLARMDRLEATDRQALRAASIFGQYFAIEALRHLSGLPDYDCRPLLAQGLVRPSGKNFLFSHALVQEGAYSSLPGSERRLLHRQAGEWFADRDPVLTAKHLDRAEDETAPAAYLTAARSQARLYRYKRALELAERGLAIASETADRFALACCRGELLLDLGEITAARAAYEEAFALASDDAARCRAWLGLAAVKRMTDDLDGALADVKMAEEAAERLDMLEEAARAHFLHGNLLFPRGDMEGCLREHHRSLELARRIGSPELEAAALGGLGDAEYMRGRMVTAKERFQRCVELADRHGFGRIAVANRPMLATSYWYSGDMRAVLREALIAVDEAARVGHLRAEMIGQMNVALAQYWLLDLDAALDRMEACLRMTRQMGLPRFEAETLAFRGDLHRVAGRRAQAVTDLKEAVAFFRRAGTEYFGPSALGFLATAADDNQTRESALAEGEALLTTNAIAHNHLNFHQHAIEACLEAGRWDEARRNAAALEEFVCHEPFPWSTFFVARGRALADHGEGRRDAELVAELEDIREEGKRYGYLITLPSIEAALEMTRPSQRMTSGRQQ